MHFMATAKQQAVKSARMKERAIERRNELWPEVGEDASWNRTGSNGFSTIPRTLVLIGTIADMLAAKNKRISTTYLGLWCRVWDTGVVNVDNEYELATEAGFTGERRAYTWRDRIKQLSELGFIKVKPGSKGPYQNILIINPYHVLCNLHEKKSIQSEYWQFLLDRTSEIGAKDITNYQKSMKNT